MYKFSKLIFISLILSILCLCVSCAKETKLSNYITNYGEVQTMIETITTRTDIVIEDGKNSNLSQLKQSGNGTYQIKAGGTIFNVEIQNKLACTITWNDGFYDNIRETPSYSRIRVQQISEAASATLNTTVTSVSQEEIQPIPSEFIDTDNVEISATSG